MLERVEAAVAVGDSQVVAGGWDGDWGAEKGRWWRLEAG